MVHHAAVLSSFLESIYLADPIDENRGALCSWLNGDTGSLDHNSFLAMVAKVEGLPYVSQPMASSIHLLPKKHDI